MSDTSIDDKTGATRRNLMILATGIVVFGFLRLPIDGKFIGVVDLKGVNQIQVWLVAWIGLWYFAIRYVLDPKSAESLKNQMSEAHGLQEKILLELLEKDLHQEETPPPAHWEDLDRIPPDATLRKFILLKPAERESTWSYNRKRQTAYATGWWRGIKAGETHRSDLTQSVSIKQKISADKLRKCAILAFARTVRPTWPFLEYLFPLVWATFAHFMCSYKMWILGFPPLKAAFKCVWSYVWSWSIIDQISTPAPFSIPLIWI